MATNTNGTLVGALVLQEALALVTTVRPVLKNISLGLRDLDGRVSTAKKGQAIYTRVHGLPTVNDFGTGASNKVSTEYSVTMDLFKEVHHEFTPAEYMATDRELVKEAALPMATAIANFIIDSVAAKWIAANFSNSTTVASGWSYSNTLVALRTALTSRGVNSDRFAVFNSTVYGALLGDTTVVSALNNPANGNAIATGKLPALPTTGNMVGFAGSKDSTIFAMRAPMDPREALPGADFPGIIDYIQDPISGMQVMVNQWIDPATLKANTRLVFLGGVAVGPGTNGQILKTA